jgi:hypothetical protein
MLEVFGKLGENWSLYCDENVNWSNLSVWHVDNMHQIL